jgi:arylsulfatase A-like enzyme
LGRVVDAVDKARATERTGWAFFTDHGEYLGDYGLVEKWPSGLNDCLVHNPLIVSLPGQAAGTAATTLVELVDVLPTLVELADTEAPHSHFGRSLVPVIEDPSAVHRATAFSEGGHRLDEPHVLEEVFEGPYREKAAIQHRDPRAIGKAVCIRTPAWTYTWRLGDIDELYDRSADPNEQINLAARPEHGATIADLKGQLFEWLVVTNDVVPFQKDPRFPAN